MEFNYYIPTRLIFGQGKFACLGEETSKLGKRALLVTYPSQSLAAYVEQAIELHLVKLIGKRVRARQVWIDRRLLVRDEGNDDLARKVRAGQEIDQDRGDQALRGHGLITSIEYDNPNGSFFP